MNCSKNEERSIWVIKDQDGNFAHKGSIFKSSKDQFSYVSTRTFSRESRGYIEKHQAQSALDYLNTQNELSEFKLTFHLELAILSKLISINNNYLGDNLVILEQVASPSHLKLVKTPLPLLLSKQSCESCECDCLHNKATKRLEAI